MFGRWKEEENKLFEKGEEVVISKTSTNFYIRKGGLMVFSMIKDEEIKGVIEFTDCRLPIAFKFSGELINPMGGLHGVYKDVVYNDLLVQTKKGLVFTSSFEVKRSKKQIAENYLKTGKNKK